MKSPADLAARLTKQWQVADNREARLLDPDTWPVTLPIGKPTPAQLTHQTDQVRTHLQRWRSVAIGEVVYEPVSFRSGAEPVEIPVAWRLRSAQEWASATGNSDVQTEYRRLRTLLREIDPIFHRTLLRQKSLMAEQSDEQIIKAAQVALQLTQGCAQGRPLRSLSVCGIDTKFFERHRRLMLQLMDARFEGQVSDLGLEAFLGALDETDHWLLVAPLAPGLLPFAQQRIRATELADVALPGTHLVVVENEKSLHQLPPLADTIAVLGAGLHLEWMSAPTIRIKRIAYWGDMDTWGLIILAKARMMQPNLTALMMDRPLFDTCRATAVPETPPAAEHPPEGLTVSEQDFYRYLRDLERGRIEQEFIPKEQTFSAFEHWRKMA